MSDKELIRQEIERRIENLKISLDKNCVTEESKLDIRGNITTLYGLLKFINSLPEESGCEVNFTTKNEVLEEEINRFEDWINNFNQSDYPTSYTVRDIARHFAHWQHGKDFDDLLQSEMKFPKEFYERGRADTMKEMMKDAVDAFVNTYENTDDSNYVEFVTEQSPYKFKETDKVKIIIIKEEQQ